MTFLLAMDHRASLARDVYGVTGDVTAAQARHIADGKSLVFDGLLDALSRGLDPATAGVLVDERYGSAVADAAREHGISLAMPIERSGRDYFTLEYGDDWLDHVRAYRPDHVKVLVRDNPGFPAADRQQQWRDLSAVSATLHAEGWSFLFELLVPPLDDQKGDRYDADIRPDLTIRVITEFQDAGVEPDIWKIEGLDDADAARRVVAAARRDGRDGVRCIVLGRDAPADQLDRWLTVAAGVNGFDGFAIGRSIWEQPLEQHLSGDLDRSGAVTAIADTYLHFCATYRAG